MHFNREYKSLFLVWWLYSLSYFFLSFPSQSRKVPYQSLEDDCDRRVMGHATKVKARGKLFFFSFLPNKTFQQKSYNTAAPAKSMLTARCSDIYVVRSLRWWAANSSCQMRLRATNWSRENTASPPSIKWVLSPAMECQLRVWITRLVKQSHPLSGRAEHWACEPRGRGGGRAHPRHHGPQPPPGDADGRQEGRLPAAHRGRQHGGGPAQHVGWEGEIIGSAAILNLNDYRNVFHDAEIDRGGRVCLLRQDSAQVLGGGDQFCIQVGSSVIYKYPFRLCSWLIFQQAEYMSGLRYWSRKIVEKVGRVSGL